MCWILVLAPDALLLFLRRLWNTKYVVIELVTGLQMTGEDLCSPMLLLFFVWICRVNVGVREAEKLHRCLLWFRKSSSGRNVPANAASLSWLPLQPSYR